jgi:hypothetical protein
MMKAVCCALRDTANGFFVIVIYAFYKILKIRLEEIRCIFGWNVLSLPTELR